ncbi:MAG: LPS export ABC transporter periplasmic protein LptC [Pseudomonadota bacterium]
MSTTHTIEPMLARNSSRRKRRGRLIGALRIVLPAVALALVGLVVAWPHIMPASVGVAVPSFTAGDNGQTDMLRMDSPSYVGQTNEDRPYELRAHSASLDPLASHIVHLDRPAADIEFGEEGDVRLLADNGIYDRDTGKLLLDGGIEVTTSSGYRFATPSARVNLAEGRVRGAQAIEGTGPAGHLTADRFEIKDAGEVLRFEGRVKVTVLPQSARKATSGPKTTLLDRGRSS